jgi:hypothetical protein
MRLPPRWKERALELASAEKNVLDLRLHRRSLEGRRRRVVDLCKDGVIDRVEFDREIQIIENRLRTVAPAEVTLVELSMADFEDFGQIWDLATPEERSELLGRMAESLYVYFKTGQLVELVPKPGFRHVFEGAAITRPLASCTSGHQLTIGDPEGGLKPPTYERPVYCSSFPSPHRHPRPSRSASSSIAMSVSR